MERMRKKTAEEVRAGGSKRKERRRDWVLRGLLHLEVEFVALIAVVFAFLMHQVAVRAFERVAVVWRDVRIGGLDVLRLRDELLGVMAARAGFDRRHLGILHVLTVAGLALKAGFDVLFGELFTRLDGSGAAEQDGRGGNGSKERAEHSGA